MLDVIIIGGGPAGSTVASLLKKYNPDLTVSIYERAIFPRDHVGESQLPSIGPILEEMGVWDKIEAAKFPIKIGASYTWGRNNERWDFDFYPIEDWKDNQRPEKYEGQRKYTAFQVDRAIYDNILLRHSEEKGVEVHENQGVKQVLRDGDKITGLQLADDSIVRAKYYVDATGVTGLFRKTFSIENWSPQELKNIAVWNYWTNADWAVEIGKGATRVQVRSLPYGWIWFIPLGETRTSVGLICPAEYVKQNGKSAKQLYQTAIQEQKEIASLLKNATPEGDVSLTKDWSHLLEQLVGDNWFVCGEAAGFADPILAAGMSLAHSSAREVAYTILAIEKKSHDQQWLKDRYEEKTRNNIQQHIKFAQYWYAANGCFTDLQQNCSAIAKEAGLQLSPEKAWQWLSQGGFTTEQLGLATFGSFDISSARQLISKFDKSERVSQMKISGFNKFKLNTRGAKPFFLGHSENGEITQVPCLKRGQQVLPDIGYYQTMTQLLKQTSDIHIILANLKSKIANEVPPAKQNLTFSACIQALEAMAEQNWVECKVNKKKPIINIGSAESRHIRSSAQADKAIAKSKNAHILKSNI
ncbi:NAD(P)/FAD-dependent oxidoreductase [Aliiglaciecola sp. 2_MG-2023]|uniref:NAD(P)/FAD-dependent oxidoreductase n=1 Tax=unclassified Aliiglaciecola TaxID=2593648 RepID=UPI0026E26972|nr:MULTISPECIES: NAD(P)/FAD-dependent oxidoreductase [unclassified Aliiglaciecola]MDO6709820.1 NAD(P)/FAD-dependent oxidoreductase [Aliiglaciecola sp. 2_MG-2023]MDO6750638.1 NAD(P)/FAD-dependent oxidoreductase [Aliiglaciecola sp. 1_MG-2023]